LKKKDITLIRDRICILANKAGNNGAHVGSALSLVEIVSAVILNKFNLILSKGHGALGLYAVLEYFGYIQSNELERFNSNGSKYYCHAVKDNKYIQFSGGSLGLGLPYAIGKSLANPAEKYAVLVGDGELDEGICWESFSFLSQIKLRNLLVIIDRNNLQSDGNKDDIISARNLKERLSGWNFYIEEVNGHDLSALKKSINNRKLTGTKLIIANTIKGNGFEIFANNPDWHYGTVNDKLLSQLIQK
jgi:transketolase